MMTSCIGIVTSGSKQREGAGPVATDHLSGCFDRVYAIQTE